MTISILLSPEDFDEDKYLCANEDVARAVGERKFQSGWMHALTYGYRENRPGISDKTKSRIEALWQEIQGDHQERVPPTNLIKRVHGQGDTAGFYIVGATAANDIDEILIHVGRSGKDIANVLDFGCGCGRVLVHLKKSNPAWNLYATDIDAEAIRWCQDHIGQLALFATNDPDPPISYPDNYFDLIYSISIFTHLPEQMQNNWLSELNRIVKPDGILILTTLDIGLRQAGDAKGGFAYDSTVPTEGLPDFYQLTHHSHDYIMKHWSRYLEISEILRARINRHQDAVICRKKVN